MSRNNKIFRYYRAYQWSNIFAMIRNNRRDPKICTEPFDGKLVVITGATSGIGYQAAHRYASAGANLFCINRNKKKSEALCLEIEQEYQVSCSYSLADLSLLNDIHRVGRELAQLKTPIDVLIHNAGIYLTQKEQTPDGLEKVFVVHYLSSFILNFLLMDKLKEQDRGRIILVGSEGHRFAAWGLRLDDLNWDKRRYTGLKSYGSAKTAQLLSMLVFEDHFRGSGITINTMHPGAVKSNTGQENGPVYRWFKKKLFDRTLKSPEISAEALYYLGVSQEVKNISGKFFNLTTEEEPAPPALDKEVAQELWGVSLEMGQLESKGETTAGRQQNLI